MNKLRKHILYLAIGEFAALCTFMIVYKLLALGTASFMAFLYLIFILLQGSLYWFYCYGLILKRRCFNPKVIKFLGIFRHLNLIILVAISIAIPFTWSNLVDLIIAVGIFLFGIIEYINYYWYRLSYGKSGFNIKILFDTGLKKSSINKMIHRYE